MPGRYPMILLKGTVGRSQVGSREEPEEVSAVLEKRGIPFSVVGEVHAFDERLLAFL